MSRIQRVLRDFWVLHHNFYFEKKFYFFLYHSSHRSIQPLKSLGGNSWILFPTLRQEEGVWICRLTRPAWKMIFPKGER